MQQVRLNEIKAILKKLLDGDPDVSNDVSKFSEAMEAVAELYAAIEFCHVGIIIDYQKKVKDLTAKMKYADNKISLLIETIAQYKKEHHDGIT